MFTSFSFTFFFSDELERCTTNFLKLTKRHLSNFKVSGWIYAVQNPCLNFQLRYYSFGVYLIQFSYATFCLGQDFLSPSIDRIRTYVDNLAVLNSRLFIFFCNAFHVLSFSYKNNGTNGIAFLCFGPNLVGRNQQNMERMMKFPKRQVHRNPLRRNIWKLKRRFSFSTHNRYCSL